MTTSLYLVRSRLGLLAASVDSAGILVYAGVIENADDIVGLVSQVRAAGAVFIATFADKPQSIFAVRADANGVSSQLSYEESARLCGKEVVAVCADLAYQMAENRYPAWAGPRQDPHWPPLALGPVGEA